MDRYIKVPILFDLLNAIMSVGHLDGERIDDSNASARAIPGKATAPKTER